jgi:sulfane dehydrogenase subunit SoxC
MAQKQEVGGDVASTSLRAAPVPRRKWLKSAAAVVATGAGLAANRTSRASESLAVPPWMRAPGDPVLSHPYGVPSHFEASVVRRGPPAPPAFPGAGFSLTPLQDLFGIITPTGLVFERHHAGIPDIDPKEHRLAIHGMVDRPRLYTMDDIVRFPSVSRIHFLECSGNTGWEWSGATVQSVQQTHGLLSCCEWTGVPLAVLLEEAGLQLGGKWLLAEGADGAAMARSIPLEKAMDDAFVAYAQNGERLRPEHGYPLRLLLPGYEGNTNIKWLRRIKVGKEPFMTREETSKYTDLQADGMARQFTFVMEAKSVITFPAPDHHLAGPGFYEIRGLAWSGRGAIRCVDVSTDGGQTWQPAQLQEPVLAKALTRFRLPWVWSGAPMVLQSRATDETGYVQPSLLRLLDARGSHSYYHNNAIQSWGVDVQGEIRNVHV